MGRKKITGDNCIEMINLENGQSGTKSATWNPQTVAIFCDLCIKEVGKGQRPGTHFNKEGWASLVANFHAETGNNYDKSQLKNKWDLLKKEWKLWKDLIGKETGLGWNLTKNIVDASDEWWRNKIQINPQYAKLRIRGINPDMEVKLDMMLNGAVATGKYAWAPSSDLPPPQNEKAPKDNIISLDDNLDYEEFDLNESPQSAQVTKETGNKRANGQLDTEGLKEKKAKMGGAAKLSLQINHLVEVVEARSTTTSALIKGSQSTSVSEVMKVVESLSGIEIGSQLWWFATELFCSQEKREMFSVMKDPEMKLQFILRNQDRGNNM
uniref:uncharacterized protein LOC105350510 n=1 Tax=Fragaria vesca subsp. vesca TaxID=101020 RepID=UPI0005CAA0E1|nr:PREDICTED: uncharacterized protein LOC105350510 [Fragaria vesca subsp. vesca]